MRRMTWTVGVGMMLPPAGCGNIVGMILPETVTVTFVNHSALFGVEATVAYHGDDDLPRAIIIELGEELEFVIGPGESRSFTRKCDDLEALVLVDADLLVFGGAGPEVDGDVWRIDDQFECGDEIVLTFAHSDLIFDFSLSVALR